VRLPPVLGLSLITQTATLGAEHPAAAAAAYEAREIFTRLNSPPMLARLDLLTRRGSIGKPAVSAARIDRVSVSG
jgi:hypothetical protein